MNTATKITNTEGKPHFATLDGLRGIAALSVVLLHWLDGLGFKAFGTSILAVDFFFMLSGFVVAYSYEERLKQGFHFLKFMMLRIIRLHPLIVLGAFLGFIRLQASSYLMTNQFSVDITSQLMKAIFMIPNGYILTLNIQYYFPINNALWSLFFEFIAYLLFGLILFRFKKWALILLSFFAFIGVGFWIKTEFGYDVEKSQYAWSGFPRVLFSFSCGLLIYRFRNAAMILRPKLPLSTLVLLPIFFAFPRGFMPWWFYLIIMLFLFPTCIIIGMTRKLTGTISRILNFLGEISYPIYVIHVPIMWSLTFLVKKLGISNELVYFGLIIIPIIMYIAYLALKLFDEPIRKWLKMRLIS